VTSTLDERRLLAGCDAAQAEAITTRDEPLLVVAGAGSGKTRVLTRRIAWRIGDGSALAEHVLALTFTRKAAAELRSRLAALGVAGAVTAGTFHAVALRELRRRAADVGRRPPVLLESKARLLADLLHGPGAGGARESGRAAARRELVAQLAGEIEWASARLLTPERYLAAARSAGRETPLPPERVAELLARYAVEKRRRGLVDFEDLLVTLARGIAEDRELAAVQRWRWRHLFVDELQDVNAAQLALLDAWTGPRGDVCAVGDARQAIYGWNGAESDAMRLFTRRFPTARVIELSTNYRSSPQVVAVATAALPRRRAGAGAPGVQPAAPALPHRAEQARLADQARLDADGQGAGRPDGMIPTLRCFEDEYAEARGVARAVRLAHPPGRSFGDCAVLARTNAQLVVLERALRDAGIPVRSGSGDALLGRPAVAQALATLKRTGGVEAFSRWSADLGLACLHGSPAAGGGEAEDGSPAPLPAGDPGDAGSAERDDLAALARLAAEYAAFDSWPTAGGFLAWLAGSLVADPAFGSTNAVDLLTFHRAKGLEWSVVFVTGLEDGYVPISHARSEAALDEERRLLYVALTRAIDELHCSWCTSRTFGRRRAKREPSPYLPAIDTARRQLERLSRPDPSRARALLHAARAELRAAGDAGRTAGHTHSGQPHATGPHRDAMQVHRALDES
jgi:DNA helicase-2/ATP-dependent DNA helicase PcrA